MESLSRIKRSFTEYTSGATSSGTACASIGLKSSGSLLFFIITGPVGAYYPEGFNPVKIVVEERYSRAGPGGRVSLSGIPGMSDCGCRGSLAPESVSGVPGGVPGLSGLGVDVAQQQAEADQSAHAAG